MKQIVNIVLKKNAGHKVTLKSVIYNINTCHIIVYIIKILLQSWDFYDYY